MKNRIRHSRKEIEAALAHAEARGWRIELARGHSWGRMYCPWNCHDCRCGEFCITSIWSTPRNADVHARQLRRVVDNCSGPDAAAVQNSEQEGKDERI